MCLLCVYYSHQSVRCIALQNVLQTAVFSPKEALQPAAGHKRELLSTFGRARAQRLREASATWKRAQKSSEELRGSLLRHVFTCFHLVLLLFTCFHSLLKAFSLQKNLKKPCKIDEHRACERRETRHRTASLSQKALHSLRSKSIESSRGAKELDWNSLRCRRNSVLCASSSLYDETKRRCILRHLTYSVYFSVKMKKVD